MITGIVGRVLPRLALALGFFTMTVIGLTTRLDDRSTQQGTIVVVSKAGMFYSLDRLEVSNWRTRSIRARSNLAGERVWSPDGRELAFTSYWTHLDGNDEIYVASGETGAVINLSQHSGPDSSPVWSPDSTRLAFVSGRTGNRDIFVVARDGSNLRNVTSHPGSDYAPSWSPDGRWIAFISDRDGNHEIYVVDLSMMLATNMSKTLAEELQFMWVANS